MSAHLHIIYFYFYFDREDIAHLVEVMIIWLCLEKCHQMIQGNVAQLGFQLVIHQLLLCRRSKEEHRKKREALYPFLQRQLSPGLKPRQRDRF